ncbi:MAG: hypothetical protein AB7K68_16440 [Bacteriovoracia bacterium]
MKFIVLSLFTIAIFSVPAFAETGSFIKLLDGKFAVCEGEKNLGRGAYLPNGLSTKADGGALSIVFVLQHLRCEQLGNAFVWMPSAHPLDPVADKDIYDRPILVKRANSEAVLSRGADAAILSTVALEDSAEQSIDFGFSLEQLLSPAELGALDSGDAVDAKATFFVRGDISVQTHTGETVVLGRRAGGAYTILLTMKKADSGQVQVTNLQLK